ncbi:MAG: SUMF1/EgtB/PvdO family nonheme iron enzyme [Anaerolineaceae bacterium]|nr:SUMF1/EgtB/PvdO family nonheme iron enzyme [Anaerolineaceae bacterium]
MTTVESPYHALISYSHRDATIVKQFHKRLTDAGLSVWIDEGDIWPAADWWNEIQLGMRNANNVLFMISPFSLASVVCQQELDYARFLSKRVIPVMLNQGENFEQTQDDALVSLIRQEFDQATLERMQNRKISTLFEENKELLKRHDWIYCTSDDLLENATAEAIRCIQVDEVHHRLLTSFMQQALNWESSDRDPDRLLKGGEITEAEQWLEKATSKQLNVPKQVIQLIQASRKDQLEYEQRERDRKNREKRLLQSRQRNRLIAITLGTFVVIIAAVVAFKVMQVEQLRQAALQVPMASYLDSTIWLGEESDYIAVMADSIIGFDIQPRQQVEVPAFSLDRYEVSAANYARCFDAQICRQTAHMLDDPDPELPVVGVDAFQSAAYCNWLGKRLPTRAEWERAARGEDYRMYPWPDGIPADEPPVEMFIGIGDFTQMPLPVAVDSPRFLEGANPEGVMHLLGNVSEWTSTPVCSDPYNCNRWDGISDVDQLYTVGFSYADDFFDEVTRLGVATRSHPGESNMFIGFRCAQSEP